MAISGDGTLFMAHVHLYIVHMKRMTASEARRNWFRVLDEVAGGETVVIERKGRRIVLRREEAAGVAEARPDYGAMLRVADPDAADGWGWEYGADGELAPREAEREPEA